MPLNAQLHIYTNAIRHNLAVIKSYIPQNNQNFKTRIWAVLKSDAYGHSVKDVLPQLFDADGIAITDLDNIDICKNNGWLKPILYMGHETDLEPLYAPAMVPMHLVVSNHKQLEWVLRGSAHGPKQIWLRYSGMLNHAGFQEEEYMACFKKLLLLYKQNKIALPGHMQHYANAEDPNALKHERILFQQNILGLPGPVCSENSAAMLATPTYASNTQWIRSGIALFGINPLPFSSRPRIDLKPAMALKAPIYAIQTIKAGSTVGYGNRFTAKKDMRIGIVRCGYADGYPRQVKNGCPCLVNKKTAYIIGRVAMDSLTIDLSGIPSAQIGDMVSLWGTEISVETIARHANTIPAALLTSVTARVPRIFHE